MSVQREQDRREVSRVIDKVNGITASDTLESFEQIALVDTTSGAVTVTLPPVADARGKDYYIKDVGVYAGSNNITIEDNNDDAGLTDITIATNSGYAVMLSDGRNWFTIDSDLT